MLSSLRNLPKFQLFALILLSIAVVGAVVSLVVRSTLLAEPDRPPLTVALLLTGDGAPDSEDGQLRQGAEQAIDEHNRRRIGSEQPLRIEVVQVADAVEAADAVLRLQDRQDVVGVLDNVAGGDAILIDGIAVPRVTLTNRFSGVAEDPWRFALLPSEPSEVRFLANYVHNVIRERTVAIVRRDDARGQSTFETFDATFRRFGTKILFDFPYPDDAEARRGRFAGVAAEFDEKKIPGFVFVDGGPEVAADLVVALREANVRNPVIGLSPLATESFVSALAERTGDGDLANAYANGVTTTTPLLFDTAPRAAQGFSNRFTETLGKAPDWTAAAGFTAVEFMSSGLAAAWDAAEDEAPTVADIREAVRVALGTRAGEPGVFDREPFAEDGLSQVPQQIGVFNGRDVISALTQLQPIAKGVKTDYLEELKRGRILYVNDRFMYKTNVVYTGMQLLGATEPDWEKSTIKLDFFVWFRFQGSFEPQDVVFANAVDPIKLEAPERARELDGMTYEAYRVSGRFRTNFSRSDRPFGNEILGVSMHHRVLSENNLRYVRDVLGMRRPDAANLLAAIGADGALSQLDGWRLSRAWLSQEVRGVSSVGDPDYVGYGKPAPNFSGIELGVLIAPDRIDVREFVSLQSLVYAAIFSFLVILFANIMDMRDMGQFWKGQTLIMRIVAWPVLLISLSNATLDYTVQNYSEYYASMVLLGWDSLWWLVAARLCVKVLHQFILTPMEIRSERRFPNLLKYFMYFSIYMLAIMGILAFVFDQHLTSLLATSGLVTFIVGLAIQGNISNLFAGLVINLERPLRVGDWVKFDDMEEGKVTDVTWRSIRFATRDGQTISIPNGKASEAAIRNFTASAVNRLDFCLNVDPKANPRTVCDVLLGALKASPDVVAEPPPMARYRGTVDGYNDWGGQFEIQYWINDYGERERIENAVWGKVWDELEKHSLL